MPPDLEEIRRWLVKAHRDLAAVRQLLSADPASTDIAAFHSQQAVEKLLKAFLVFREIQFEKVHDLGVLLEQCAGCDRDFVGLTEDVTPLSAYAVAFRYPGSTDPTKEEAESAYSVAQRVWDFVTQRLPKEVHP